jgi:hypothetical protein
MILVHFGSLWTIFDRLGLFAPSWTVSDQLRPFWTILGSWAHLALFWII